jgi:hypothetical protein
MVGPPMHKSLEVSWLGVSGGDSFSVILAVVDFL